MLGQTTAAIAANHPLHLLQAGKPTGLGLRFAVDSGLGQHSRQESDRISGAQPNPQVVVHDVVEREIEPADGHVRLASEERCGLKQEVRCPDKPFEVPRLYVRTGPNYRPGAIDEFTLAVQEPRSWIDGQFRYGRADRPRYVPIVRVEPGNVFARPGQESAMDGIGLAGIRSRYPTYPVTVAAQHIEAGVRAAAVQHQVLDGRIVLSEHRVDRIRDE